MQVSQMRYNKNAFNIITSIEKHLEHLIPLIPKQAIVCIGEYPIKMMLKQPIDGIIPVFIEKSSGDVHKWLPKGYKPHLIIGYEDVDIATHFWYDVLPTIVQDKSVIDCIKKQSQDKLRGTIIFGSIWDGVGSASIPSLITQFQSQNIDSLSIAILPSKIQPPDAHFNTYASLQLCLATENSTVLCLDRDLLETFNGVDRKGIQIKGNAVVNYLLDLMLAKESLVKEISELSRTFNIKLFSALVITAASFRVYGSLNNMLDIALLKPLSNFDLSSSSLLYVLLRMPAKLKEAIPRTKLELAITNWFRAKTAPQSIHISEPIYTEDMNDRIDAILLFGGYDTAKLFAELDFIVSDLKHKAVKNGLMTEKWLLPKIIDGQPAIHTAPVNATTSQSTKTRKKVYSESII